MRELIISECSELLTNRNYSVSQSYCRSCFDIIALNNKKKFLIKILKNIDSLSREQSIALLKLAKILNAIPLLIGSRTRNYLMDDGVVYERHNIKSITKNTFKNYLNGNPPVIYAKRGGFFVNIDGKELKKIREEQHISIGELANIANVSRKTIYKYEQNAANPSYEVAIKIEEYLDKGIAKEIDLSKLYGNEILEENLNNSENYEEDEFKMVVLDLLRDLGFNLTKTEKAPFDLVAEDKHKEENFENSINNINSINNTLILTNIEEHDNIDIRKKATIVSQISELLNGYSVIISDDNIVAPKNIQTLTFKELEKMEDTIDLLDHILQYKKGIR